MDRGKEEGAADSFLIESEIRAGWIIIEEINTSDSIKEIAEGAGIEIRETAVIMLARRKNCTILLDDLAARRFAIGLGLEVAGSIGVLIRSAKIRRLSKSEALDALERLARVMWLSVDVYEDARKTIEGL